MKIHLDRTGTVNGLGDIIQLAMQDGQAKGLLVFSCDHNELAPGELDPLLRKVPVPLFGGAFPALIFDDAALERGSAVVGLPTTPVVRVLRELSGDLPSYDHLVDALFPNSIDAETMFVIVDGMGSRVSTLLDSLFNVLGLEINYIGGGAGSLRLKRKPCVMTNEGLVQDCAVLAAVGLRCGIGVRHGMESVAGPFRITEASGNTIHTLDWKPALQLYREVVLSQPEHDNGDVGFYGIDRHFSLGINRLDAEKVIREPVNTTSAGGLSFTSEIKEGEFVDVMRATPESTIEAARRAVHAARQAFAQASSGAHALTLCFACTARQDFLAERYREELAAINDGETPLVGALTIGGEIANSGKAFIDYYNRACVVGALG